MKLPDLAVNALGFTGTRNGMSAKQMRTLLDILKLPDAARTRGGEGMRKVFHHGGAVGADMEAHRLARAGTVNARVYVHPAERDAGGQYNIRAWADAEHVYGAQPPLTRNRDIVEACQLLVACPKGVEEEVRSGTWMTVRYARSIGKPYVIIQPDGSFAL